MKKTVIALLMLVTAYALFTGCGKSTDATAPAASVSETVTEKQSEETTVAETTVAETTKEPETENEPETEAETEKPTKEKEPETAPVEEIQMNTDAVIEETVLYDEDGLKIIAKELTFSRSDMEIKLRFENSSEKNLNVTSNTVGYSCNAVNGRMIEDGYLNVKVTAGKNAIDTVNLSLQELLLGGITEIADIELGFTISDDDHNYIYTGPIRLSTSLSEEHDPSSDSYKKSINSEYLKNKYSYSIESFMDEDLPSGDCISVISETEVRKKNGEHTVFLELYNNSDEMVYVSLRDISVNGLKVATGSWDSVTIIGNHTATLSVTLENALEEKTAEILGISDYSLLNAGIRVKSTDEAEEEIEEFPIEMKLSDSEPSFDDTGDVLYDSNDIRIITKGFFEDSSSYSNTIHVLFLVENNRNSDIYFNDKYGSFSVNDLMTDAYLNSQTVGSGETVLMDLQIWEMYFEQADIKGIDDIETAQFTAEIRDENYSVIESCELNFQNEKP